MFILNIFSVIKYETLFLLTTFIVFWYTFFASFFCALPFNMTEYDGHLQNSTFSQEIVVGEITDWRHAKEQGLQVATDYFGSTPNGWPFNVFFDEENDVWLIRGTRPPFILSAQLHVFIRGSDGRVIHVGR